jgi:hypothetical protein
VERIQEISVVDREEWAITPSEQDLEVAVVAEVVDLELLSLWIAV